MKLDMPVKVEWSFVEKGVVLPHKLPSHALGARNCLHDHADSITQVIN